MASGTPITFLADLHAWQGPTGNHCLFFEAREVGESMCPEGLRLLESVRHSTAFFSLYTPEGRMLESNPAFTREFGNVFADDSDRFLKLFADNVLNKNTSAGALFRLKAPEKPRQCWRFSLGQFSKPHFPFALSLSKGPCGIRQIKHLA